MGRNAFYAVSLMAMMLIGEVQLAAGAEIPTRLAKLLYYKNGNYSGMVDTVDPLGNPVNFQGTISFIPIIVPGHEKPTVLYWEHDPLNRYFILEFTQDLLGAILGSYYSVTADDAKESLKESPAKLPENAEFEPLPLSSEVVAEADNGAFEGIWLDSTWPSSGGISPYYKYKLDCDGFEVTIPSGNLLETFHLNFQSDSRYAWVPDVLAEMEKAGDPCNHS